MNRESLDVIERCIFVLCLDERGAQSNTIKEDTYSGQEIRDDVSLAKQMLHGLGTGHNSCNRWFDKTMQVCLLIL